MSGWGSCHVVLSLQASYLSPSHCRSRFSICRASCSPSRLSSLKGRNYFLVRGHWAFSRASTSCSLQPRCSARPQAKFAGRVDINQSIANLVPTGFEHHGRVEHDETHGRIAICLVCLLVKSSFDPGKLSASSAVRPGRRNDITQLSASTLLPHSRSSYPTADGSAPESPVAAMLRVPTHPR